MHRNCVALCLLLLTSPVMARSRSAVAPTAPNPATSGKLRRHSKVYIARMGGFETTLFAAIDKEVVPLVIVQKPEDAEFDIKETGTERVTWAHMIFASQPTVTSQPEIVVTSVYSGEVVLACPVPPLNSQRDRDRAADDCAKRLKRTVLQK
ncbi:MAG TPA: hypothetical protein VE994_17390 [Terriglobales bacterium]|nr:hypothetical protein [Terriglobales bacterium]